MASSGTYSTYTSAPVRPVKTETTPLRGKVRDSTGCCGDVCDMAAFEYRADVKDLELDGRHWRELFGGATGGGTKMGAYIICGPAAFVVFRLFLAMISTGIFCWTVVHSFKTTTQGYWALYYTNWTVTLSCAYFLLAAGLTTFAVCTNGQESRRTPVLVWLCWILYGMLVPTAQIAFLAYWLVVFDGTVYAVSIAATAGTLVITLLDMWINRQPYYYSFHAVFGVSIKCVDQAAPTLHRSPTVLSALMALGMILYGARARRGRGQARQLHRTRWGTRRGGAERREGSRSVARDSPVARENCGVGHGLRGQGYGH